MTNKSVYAQVGSRKTSQRERIPGRNDQVKNSAGGFVFELGKWDALNRFLVLGTEGGTYYAGAKNLTMKASNNLRACIAEDGKRVVDMIVEISQSGRAPKNDPAIFALALCSAADEEETRKYALDNMHKVCRIGTHLFQFMSIARTFRGSSRMFRTATQNWYLKKTVEKVAYQAVKYQQRHGWSHRDVLRMMKPVPETADQDNLFAYITGKKYILNADRMPDIVVGVELAKKAENAQDIVDLITDYGITREMIPTKFLNEPKVWKAMLMKGMPLTAMVRNLGKMSSIDLFNDTECRNKVVSALTDQEYIRKSRLHPLAALIALKTYQNGTGLRGSLRWHPVARISDALEDAFQLSFGNVEGTGKRIMLALDVSPSMSANIANTPIACNEAVAAMSLITAKTENNYEIMAFDSGFRNLGITAKSSFASVLRKVYSRDWSGTDCSLPMIYAMKHKILLDAFIVYTDNETWGGRSFGFGRSSGYNPGSIQPFQALQEYRQKMGIPAKLIVVGMTATNFTIADPQDPGMMDVVGFDTAAPNIMADFIARNP